MTAPEVSVVIPTRNRPRRLLRTLRSAIGQRDVRIEIVVVDDASTDDVLGDLLMDIGLPLQLIRHDSRRGLAEARNTGVRAARGHWVAFLDDDDLWSPDKLRRQLDAASSLGAPWAFCAALILCEGPDRAYRGPPLPPNDGLLEWLLAWQPLPAGASNVIAHADLLRELSGFDTRLAHLADAEMWIRLASSGPAGICAEALVAYVHHDGNMHREADVSAMLREMRYLERKHAALRARHQVTDRDSPIAHWIAGTQIATGRRWSASRVYLDQGIRRADLASMRRAVAALLKPTGTIHRGNNVRVDIPDWLEVILRMPERQWRSPTT